MMSEELGLQVEGKDDTTIRDGVLMFLSFAIFGSLPLLGYVVSSIASKATIVSSVCVTHETAKKTKHTQIVPIVNPNIGTKYLFAVACTVTLLSLFSLGAIKAKFSSKT